MRIGIVVIARFITRSPDLEANGYTGSILATSGAHFVLDEIDQWTIDYHGYEQKRRNDEQVVGWMGFRFHVSPVNEMFSPCILLQHTPT